MRSHVGLLRRFVPFACSPDGLRDNKSTLKASPALRFRMPASFLVLEYFCMSGVPRIEQRQHFSSFREGKLPSVLLCWPAFWGGEVQFVPHCRLKSSLFVRTDFIKCTSHPSPVPWGAHGAPFSPHLLWQFTFS